MDSSEGLVLQPEIHSFQPYKAIKNNAANPMNSRQRVFGNRAGFIPSPRPLPIHRAQG